jgi:hypothetical protein
MGLIKPLKKTKRKNGRKKKANPTDDCLFLKTKKTLISNPNVTFRNATSLKQTKGFNPKK